MRPWLLVPLLTATSCYQPQFASGKYRCDQPADVCPGNFVCVAGRCVDPKEAGDLGASPDLSMEPADLSVPPDLRVPADMARPAHCTLVGMANERDILACKGSFTMGNFAGICPNGYRVCTKDDQMLLRPAADGTICGGLGGFFAANISASIKNNTTQELVCDSNSQMNGWVLVGCGREVSAADPLLTGTVNATNQCRGLKVFVPCNNTVRGWSCSTGLSNASHTNMDRGGLLCCKS